MAQRDWVGQRCHRRAPDGLAKRIKTPIRPQSTPPVPTLRHHGIDVQRDGHKCETKPDNCMPGTGVHGGEGKRHHAGNQRDSLCITHFPQMTLHPRPEGCELDPRIQPAQGSVLQEPTEGTEPNSVVGFAPAFPTRKAEPLGIYPRNEATGGRRDDRDNNPRKRQCEGYRVAIEAQGRPGQATTSSDG